MKITCSGASSRLSWFKRNFGEVILQVLESVECLSVWSLDLSKVIWNPRRDNLVQAGDPTMYRSVPDPAAPLRWTFQPRLVRSFYLIFIDASLCDVFVTQLDWFTMIHLYSNDWTCAYMCSDRITGCLMCDYARSSAVVYLRSLSWPGAAAHLAVVSRSTIHE